MYQENGNTTIDQIRLRYPKKFATEEKILRQAAHTADVALAVRDDYQNKGVGYQLFSYITYLAKKQGLLGFTASILMENDPMLHLCRKMGFHI